MNAYNYHPVTGVYLGTVPCQQDPVDGGYLMPAHSTDTRPPAYNDGQAAVWSGTEWTVIEAPADAAAISQTLPELVDQMAQILAVIQQKLQE